jgi:hypothetical protein
MDSVAFRQIDPRTIHSIAVVKSEDGGGIIEIRTTQIASHHE